jgi:hypothetical protein
MDPRRLQLQSLLETILGSVNVYFQPPATMEMQYPCIVYHRDIALTEHADDLPYRRTKRYQVTVIDRDPDSRYPDDVAQLPLCKHSRFFTAYNLNHDVFDLYY